MSENKFAEPSAQQDRIARQIVDAAFSVHSALGPGLLESVYETCLSYELESREISVRRQVAAPIVYRDLRVEAAFRIDLVVDGSIAVEIKAVERALPVHEAQLLTYMKLCGLPVGFLINFNVPLLKQGIRRFVLSK